MLVTDNRSMTDGQTVILQQYSAWQRAEMILVSRLICRNCASVLYNFLEVITSDTSTCK